MALWVESLLPSESRISRIHRLRSALTHSLILDQIRQVTVQLGDQTQRTADVCGPVNIELEGFAPIYGEVLFVDMAEHGGSYEPLLGYIPLEQLQAAVDMIGHRLVPIKTVDLKMAA